MNDETFGDPHEGDWEGLHENLVKLSKKEVGGIENGSVRSEDDDDLDFSRFNFDDLDIPEDNDIKVQLDPTVWAAPSMSHHQQRESRGVPTIGSNSGFNPDMFIRQHFPQPQNLLTHQQMEAKMFSSRPDQMYQQKLSSSNDNSFNILATLMRQAAPSQPSVKMCTVEELERNMLSQRQQQTTANQPQQQASVSKPTPTSPKKIPQPQVQPNQRPLGPPPGMQSPRQHPMYPPHQGPMHPAMMNQGNNSRFPIPPQMMPRPPMPNMLPGGNMPMMGNMNNFNQMGPQFGPMRGPPPPPGHPMAMQMRGPPPPPGHPMAQFYNQNPNQMQKEFNMKLMEEIQQNHPMLQQLNRMHQHFHHQNGVPNHHQPQGHPYNNSQINHNNNRQMQHHLGNNNNHNKNQSNGQFNKQEPQDPYANLMSNRDKQWLISIQLLQLNTETPYFDDYYFTVYKEKKAKGGNRAHLNNTMNHPFTQAPKGHAYNMLLTSMANRNGLNNNNRNGMHNRERKNSESQNKDGKEGGRNYTPLQFENSLGKLQVGVSVLLFMLFCL